VDSVVIFNDGLCKIAERVLEEGRQGFLYLKDRTCKPAMAPRINSGQDPPHHEVLSHFVYGGI